jgi:hypothetical protein
MTVVLNFVSGPAAGKSTIAPAVFSQLKMLGRNCGWVNEFPTELVWEENLKGIKDQLWVLGEQHHRIYNQLNKVDFIVQDTSLLLQLYYCKYGFPKFKNNERYKYLIEALNNLVLHVYDQYDNKVFFVDRGNRVLNKSRYGLSDDPSNPARHEERVKIDNELKEILGRYAIPYVVVKSAAEVMEYLV